jgi:hypothetical protein
MPCLTLGEKGYGSSCEASHSEGALCGMWLRHSGCHAPLPRSYNRQTATPSLPATPCLPCCAAWPRSLALSVPFTACTTTPL